MNPARDSDPTAPSHESPAVFETLRASCAEISRRSLWVRIEDTGLERLAGLLARERPPTPTLDPGRDYLDSDSATIAHALTLNAINFGSGWFPHLEKRDGLSGYLSIATALRERFAREGPFTSDELMRFTPEACAALFGQSLKPPVDELMGLFARAWNDLGEFLQRDHAGRFAGPIEQAGGSAARLVESLGRMPLYRDVFQYQGLEVPFFKRAQITCADLAAAFRERGPGRFRDFSELTLFADNLVPHVLRMLGVLAYDVGLLARIDAGKPLESGSEEEIEIRAVALHAVERLAESCTGRGWPVRPSRLDFLLWSRGQSPRMKSEARHRTRCTFY